MDRQGTIHSAHRRKEERERMATRGQWKLLIDGLELVCVGG